MDPISPGDWPLSPVEKFSLVVVSVAVAVVVSVAVPIENPVVVTLLQYLAKQVSMVLKGRYDFLVEGGLVKC